MKKIFWFSLAALICFFLASGCSQDIFESHADTDFLVGTWSSEHFAYTFTIYMDYTFECELLVPYNPADPEDLTKGKVAGRLDFNASSLKRNDYVLRDLVTMDDAHDLFFLGNMAMNTPMYLGGPSMLESMNDIIVTITPKNNDTAFTFTSTNPLAASTFGGDGDFFKH